MSNDKLAQVSAFLLGEAPLEGVWFGENHPTERGSYWWRKHLREALAAEAEKPGPVASDKEDAELTDDEILACRRFAGAGPDTRLDRIAFARAVIRAARAKKESSHE